MSKRRVKRYRKVDEDDSDYDEQDIKDEWAKFAIGTIGYVDGQWENDPNKKMQQAFSKQSKFLKLKSAVEECPTCIMTIELRFEYGGSRYDYNNYNEDDIETLRENGYEWYNETKETYTNFDNYEPIKNPTEIIKKMFDDGFYSGDKGALNFINDGVDLTRSLFKH